MSMKKSRGDVTWVVFAERGSGYHRIVRSGFHTAAEAASARHEIERAASDDDETNYLILTTTDAEERQTEP